jgi:hypothetical protein
MRLLDPIYQTMVSELAQRSLDAAFVSAYPASGRFVPVEVNGKRYWYFDEPKDGGGQRRKYVGPAEDPEITRRVEAFKDLKADFRSRRKLVSTLIREAHLPRSDRLTGDVVEALANAGLFRLRGVLIGTAAFPTYSAFLGVRLPNAVTQTGDADFAQFHSVSAAVGDSLPPVLEEIRKVDSTFREVPHQSDGRHTTQFVSRSGFKVEFLTPNTGSADRDDKPVPMPALGGASAAPLRFLDFLIYEPVRSILLHNAGVPVLVPAPDRFAVHKLIVASRRRNEAASVVKSEKDLRQAVALFDAMIQTHRHTDLAVAFTEAWNRGSAWKEALRLSLSRLEPQARSAIEAGLAEGVRHLGDEITKYELEA